MSVKSKQPQERLEELELTQRTAQARVQERLSKIESERERSLAQLEKQQEQEKRQELETTRREQPTGYVNAEERSKILEFLKEKRLERSRTGPSLER